jgi:hypothetical protein
MAKDFFFLFLGPKKGFIKEIKYQWFLPVHKPNNSDPKTLYSFLQYTVSIDHKEV